MNMRTTTVSRCAAKTQQELWQRATESTPNTSRELAGRQRADELARTTRCNNGVVSVNEVRIRYEDGSGVRNEITLLEKT